MRLAVLISIAAACAIGQIGPSQFNAERAAERAAELAGRMTLEEKVSQLQNASPAIPRLGIPAYEWWNEGLHGVARAGKATVFPQAIGLAAAWDADLVERVADAIATEARAKHHDALRRGIHGRYFGLTFWSPNINIFRDPRWGRGHETYGEDQFLTGTLAAAFVRGMQGRDPVYLKTIATPKHFAVHSGPEPDRHAFNAEVSAEDLAGTYLPAFQAAVQAGAASVMCAYNAVNGHPACASQDLLANRLRGDWGFGGYVVSDCGAINDIWQGHKTARTRAEAAAVALRAGTDLSCGDEYGALAEAVADGLVKESDIDRALIRLLTARFRLGMFDPPEEVPFAQTPMSVVDSREHQDLALEATRKSIVLLKNDGLLPLGRAIRRIAVIGPAADEPSMQLGNYNGIPSRIVTPVEGIEARFGDQAEVRFALGSTFTPVTYALVSRTALPNGLKAEYFAGDSFDTDPVLVRQEPRVFFNWDAQDRLVTDVVPRESFAVRWTGTLVAPASGEYSFAVRRSDCHDCVGSETAAVFLDRKPIDAGAKLQLTAGQEYELRVEYRQQRGGTGVELTWLPPPPALLDQAAAMSDWAEVIVVCAGLTPEIEGEESDLDIPGFYRGDRTAIELPAVQQQLVDMAVATGKPVVVVLMGGGAISAGAAHDKASALLAAWYPGQAGGTAIAEVLSGDVNPSGRLPVTFYRATADLPPFTNYSMENRTYRYFTGTPLYSFGHGLSYSRFEYSGIEIRDRNAEVTVFNTSERDGEEVVQLYAGHALGAFQRISIPAGEARVVQLPFPSGLAPQTAVCVAGSYAPCSR